MVVCILLCFQLGLMSIVTLQSDNNSCTEGQEARLYAYLGVSGGGHANVRGVQARVWNVSRSTFRINDQRTWSLLESSHATVTL